MTQEYNRGQAQTIGGLFGATGVQDFNRTTAEMGVKTLLEAGGEISLSLNTQRVNSDA